MSGSLNCKLTTSNLTLFLSPYCTRLEPIFFPRTLTDFARAARVPTRTNIVCSDCVVTRTPPRASRTRRDHPPPRSAFPCFFFFAGGCIFELNGAERGLGRAVALGGADGRDKWVCPFRPDSS